MLGLDTLEPFIKTARTFDKGLFVLVRTSNPGSAELQDVKLADGRTWSEMLADKLAPLAAAEGMVGKNGFSSIGAVVGATQPQTMTSLRDTPAAIHSSCCRATAQGATAEMTRAAFRDGKGAGFGQPKHPLRPSGEKVCGYDWRRIGRNAWKQP